MALLDVEYLQDTSSCKRSQAIRDLAAMLPQYSYTDLEKILPSMLLPDFIKLTKYLERPLIQHSCFIKVNKYQKVAAFMPSSSHTIQEAGKKRVHKGSLSLTRQNLCQVILCALEKMQLGMQSHLRQPGHRGFLKFHC